MVLPGFRGPYSGMTFRDGVRRITVGPHPHPTNSLLLSERTPFPRDDAADQGSFSGGQQTKAVASATVNRPVIGPPQPPEVAFTAFSPDTGMGVNRRLKPPEIVSPSPLMPGNGG